MKLPPRNGQPRTQETSNTLLIDGNALFKRGFTGAKEMVNREGRNVGGLYQFITVTRKLLREDVYNSMYVFWDGKFGGKLRHDIYPLYKSARGKNYETGTVPESMDELLQQYMVKEYIYNLSIPQIDDDITEADDFIAHYVNNKGVNERIVIVTSDRDLCQLIQDNVVVYLLDKHTFITMDNYHEYFNHDYRNVALIKTIAGDKSDTIKGIKGVGEKTLLEHFPYLKEREATLSEILSDAEKIISERKTDKKTSLKALDNIVNRVTTGPQGKNIFEINNELVNLKNPKITKDGLLKYNDSILNTPIIDNGFKNVIQFIKRDGLDYLIKEYYLSDYFMPFKKLKDRKLSSQKK